MRKIAEQRLIDANSAKKSLLSYYSFVNENTSKSNYTGETLMSYEVADMIEDCMDNAPTINPETLPIVRQLREELKKANENYQAGIATALSQREEAIARAEKSERERDAAICDMEALMWYSGEGCNICANSVEVHREPYIRLECKLGKNCDCAPKWRGIDKEE